MTQQKLNSFCNVGVHDQRSWNSTEKLLWGSFDSLKRLARRKTGLKSHLGRDSSHKHSQLIKIKQKNWVEPLCLTADCKLKVKITGNLWRDTFLKFSYRLPSHWHPGFDQRQHIQGHFCHAQWYRHCQTWCVAFRPILLPLLCKNRHSKPCPKHVIQPGYSLEKKKKKSKKEFLFTHDGHYSKVEIFAKESWKRLHSNEENTDELCLPKQ